MVIDKPKGRTSAAVVADVRSRLGGVKAGHTGTLDPMATGVLPICLADATKLAGVMIADDKRYAGEVTLGVETDSYDADGVVVASDAPAALRVPFAEIAKALAGFVGEIDQTPPRLSAIKVGGRRLHERVRDGEHVEPPVRRVHIKEVDLVWMDAGREGRAPKIHIEVECSKGTFIRSLAHDLGKRLGCGAHLSALRRLRSGIFGLGQALVVDDVTPASAAQALIPVVELGLPQVQVGIDLITALARGAPLEPADLDNPPESGMFFAVDPRGRPIAVLEKGLFRLRYVRVFLSQPEAEARVKDLTP